VAAKWNLELAVRRRSGGGGGKSQSSGGGGGGGNESPRGGGGGSSGAGPQSDGLNKSQAEQILKSIGQEELRTRRDRTGRTRVAGEAGVKDW